jgi:hypothetical protein
MGHPHDLIEYSDSELLLSGMIYKFSKYPMTSKLNRKVS